MTDKTKRRLCGAAAAGYLVFCAAVPVAKADTTTYWWGVTAHKLTESERDLAERIVMAEAGGCVYEGMVGVAQVIRENTGVRYSRTITSTGNSMASIIANQFGEADGLRLSSLIAIGLVLFMITATINLIGKIMIKRTRIS